MKIGFSNGDFCRLETNPMERFSDKSMENFKSTKTNAIELHCLDKAMLDFLINCDKIDLSAFKFISIHAPVSSYSNNKGSREILSRIETLCEKYAINNVVFHSGKILDWEIFKNYKKIPISIENMDEDNQFGRTIEDIGSILQKYDFRLTLDLQHCFINDQSMKLALDFQKKFKDKIAEFHLSGYKKELKHYPLFKTKQDEIIKALRLKNIPIIIESTFDKIGEEEKELAYITERLI